MGVVKNKSHKINFLLNEKLYIYSVENGASKPKYRAVFIYSFSYNTVGITFRETGPVLDKQGVVSAVFSCAYIPNN